MRIPAVIVILTLIATVRPSSSPQGLPERFWIAGRYDGNRVIVYFEAVKLGGSIPGDAVRIPKLVEYKDGVELSKMPTLATISFAE